MGHFTKYGLLLFAFALPRPGLAYVKFVNDDLVRGSQPDESTLRLLKARGVKAVINLRQSNISKEAAMVQRADSSIRAIPCRTGARLRSRRS